VCVLHSSTSPARAASTRADIHAGIRGFTVARGPSSLVRGSFGQGGGVIDEPTGQAAAACVLTVDDHAPFRKALRYVIDATSTLVIVGEADCGETAVALVRELAPDLVLMDVRMPGLGGIGATREIKRIRPDTVVVLVSTARADELPPEAEECLADAHIWKGDLSPGLLDEIWAREGLGRR
jgi:CheY-like chemotaxis protein